MFIVTKEGVYRHAILGLYKSEHQAKQRAIECSKSESDGYHDFCVSRVEFGACDDVMLVGSAKRSKYTAC